LPDKPEHKKPKFKTGIAREVRPADPESLFRDLKGRSSDIRHLWSHQADLLRAYDKIHLQTPDIALELPTGTGKTLIGLLLAEYRRRKFDERPLYLCPTRQLAHQVAQHAEDYGLRAALLLPRSYDGLNDFLLGNAVGIATYSGLFNINPQIKDPHVIVLDDAHSSEDYIAGLWSVRISRRDREDLYRALLELVRPDLEGWFAEKMLDEEFSPDEVDLLPLPYFWKHVPAIRSLLDAKLEGDDQRFSWSMIWGNLQACCLYISWNEVLLRPFIPPTMTHKPFSGAKQRIYMSATLGEGGELERITGVHRIARLPVPEGWDKQSSGRRLFLFPNMTMDNNEALEMALHAVFESNRALVLTPRMTDCNAVKERFQAGGIRVLESRDIEESLDRFTTAKEAALVLANRYDGIDLPGDACRLLILAGLPAGTNLQERFFLSRLAATSLLRDRLRTRFTQAVGRCCRSSNDYAAVIVSGQQAFDFCAKRDTRSGMHPELQAELEFGIENSKDKTADKLIELIKLLFERGDDWSSAEDEILRLREGMKKVKDPVAGILMKIAQSEVDFLYDLWRKDYESALEKAQGISDTLGGNDTDGYRAWWYYLAGCAAWLSGKEQDNADMMRRAEDLFGRAAKCSKSISWFSDLARLSRQQGLPLPMDVDTTRACEMIYKKLANLGIFGQRFDRDMNSFLALIEDKKSDPFERGLVEMGKWLGYESYKPSGDGAPDPVWRISDRLAIVFEAKSDETDKDPISLTTVRQASTHSRWVKEKHQMPPAAEIITVVTTPRETLGTEAQRHAEGLFYFNVDDIRTMARNLVAVLRRVRSVAQESDQEGTVKRIHAELARANLLPSPLLRKLKDTPLGSLPKPNTT